MLSLKPPIGYNLHYQHRSLGYILFYWVKFGIWKCDVVLFNRFGRPMGEKWFQN